MLAILTPENILCKNSSKLACQAPKPVISNKTSHIHPIHIPSQNATIEREEKKTG
jgi:hypothetical protein